MLVDTSAYYAFINRKADNNAQAFEIFAQLGAQRRRLFTTNFIVAETHALVLSRLGRNIGAQVLQEFYVSDTTIVRVSLSDEQRAREIIFSQTDKTYSLTDATSFAVMERLRIETAFTFDRHFAQYGFAVLGPAEP